MVVVDDRNPCLDWDLNYVFFQDHLKNHSFRLELSNGQRMHLCGFNHHDSAKWIQGNNSTIVRNPKFEFFCFFQSDGHTLQQVCSDRSKCWTSLDCKVGAFEIRIFGKKYISARISTFLVPENTNLYRPKWKLRVKHS